MRYRAIGADGSLRPVVRRLVDDADVKTQLVTTTYCRRRHRDVLGTMRPRRRHDRQLSVLIRRRSWSCHAATTTRRASVGAFGPSPSRTSIVRDPHVFVGVTAASTARVGKSRSPRTPSAQATPSLMVLSSVPMSYRPSSCGGTSCSGRRRVVFVDITDWVRCSR